MVQQLKIFVKEAFAISSMIYLTITKQKRMGGFIGSRIQTAENRIKSKGGFFIDCRIQKTENRIRNAINKATNEGNLFLC